MAARTRTHSLGSHVGNGQKGLSPITTVTNLGSSECQDEDNGNHVTPNGLLITHLRNPLNLMNGDNLATGTQARKAWNLQTSSSAATSTNTLPAISSDASFATAARAAKNPSRPHVSLGVALAEMKDLPKLVRIAGNSIKGKLGSGYLSWSFGWKPLYNDLVGLSGFAVAFEQRKKELRRLAERGGLKSKYTGRSKDNQIDIVFRQSSPLIETSLAQVRAIETVLSTRRRWAVMRWVPTLPPSILRDDSARAKLLAQQMLGLHGSQFLSEAWEVLPWSWLVDYFVDVGDFLTASNNSIASLRGNTMCVMTHTRHDCTRTPYEYPSYLGVSTAHGLLETKKRSLQSGLTPISASIPIISGGKLANAVAVLAARSRAYR